jgi:hypothetical protein
MSNDKVYKTSEAERAKRRAYREANRERINVYKRAEYEANKEKILAKRKVYYQANKERINAYKKAYREANKEKIAAYREATRDSKNSRVRSKYTSDIPYKLFQLVKNASKRVLRRIATKQEAIDLLGCTFEEYKDYLESKFQPGMTWENHKKDGWHIDHILPLNESEVSQEEKLKRLHYTNTQPLWAEDNYSKGNNTVYNPEN